nr:hypothetical protein [uncultured Noviherbaspirillum sp.]
MATNVQRAAANAGLWFSIKIDSEEFIALLAADALQRLLDHPGEPLEPRSAYKRNRKVIDALARQKFMDGCPRPIKVEASDLN